MGTVLFRDFEERDVDSIYKWKNDEQLNSMIVGQYHPFSYEEAINWVHGCMGEHKTYKFWAVCTNDEEKRIIGWVSLSDIDYENMSASFHGIVIADPNYRDGFAWVESYLFVMSQTFDVMGLNRLEGKNLVNHKQSNFIGGILFWKGEGIMRQAVRKNGEFYDLRIGSILRKEYLDHKVNGEYEMSSILHRLRNSLRNRNK